MSKKKKIVLVLAVLLVIGAGVGFYFYNKRKQESAGTTNATTPGVLPNTPLSPEETIKALYREILGREADQVGLDYWTTYLKSSTYQEVRARFFASPEYLAKTKVA